MNQRIVTLRQEVRPRRGRPPQATRLGLMLRRYRAFEEIGIRELAKAIGTSSATLMRIEHGYAMDAATFIKILNWAIQPKEDR